jgi:serine phosphatase RsbU (regulator of sigma subunit)
LFSQSKDSLLSIFANKIKNDTIRLNAINEVCWNYYFEKPDSTIYYAKKYIQLAQQLKHPKYEVKALNFIGGAYNNLGENSKAIEYYLKSLYISEEMKDYNELNLSYNNIGIIYSSEDNYDKAIEYYTKGLKTAEKAKSHIGIARSNSNIGLVYESKFEYENAIKYYKTALISENELNNVRPVAILFNSIARCQTELLKYQDAINNNTKALKISYKLKDKYLISYCLGELGKLYSLIGNQDSTQNYYQKKYSFVKNLEDKHYLCSYYMDMYILEKNQKNISSALAYSLKLIDCEKDVEDSINLSETYWDTGELFLLKKSYMKAISYFDSSLFIAKKINDLNFQKNAYESLSLCYSKINDIHRAFDYHVLFKTISDSIIKEINLKQISKNQRSYSAEIKEIELNSGFKTEKKQIELENSENSRRQNIVIYSIILILFFISGFSIFIFKSLQKNKKQNKLITEQKHELEHQKQEITDSINYSKRIQTAILPDLNDIKQSLTDFFILYQPKDIVSGDFYYFNKVNNDVFMAAADCTGHGVPGAFMSLVGSKELKIANAMTNSPAQILKHLNNGVKDTLRQNHIDGTKDGMDIALVRINGTTVRYSAANRPLWILKKDTHVVEEIKATKTAIAGFTEDDFEFEEHEINLAKGDTIYLFSDGYADQFGGDKQKKMTTKRFREFVLSIKDKSMHEQQLELQSFFNSWQGNTEQVDDLLVIGIRI